MAEVLNQCYPEEPSYQPQQTASWDSFFHNISVQQPSTSTSYMNRNGNNQQPAYLPGQNPSKPSDGRPENVYYQPSPYSLGQKPCSSFDFMSKVEYYQHPAYTFGSVSKASINQNQGSPAPNVNYSQGPIQTSTPYEYGYPTTIMDNLKGFDQSSYQSHSSFATIENYFQGLAPSPIHSNGSPTKMVNDVQEVIPKTVSDFYYRPEIKKEVIPKTVSDYRPESEKVWIPKTVTNYIQVTKDPKRTRGRPNKSSKDSESSSVSFPESSRGTGSEGSIDDVLRIYRSHSSTSFGSPDLSKIPNAEDMITIIPSVVEEVPKRHQMENHTPKKRICRLCTFRAHHPMDVIVHIVDNHSKVDRSKWCPFCSRKFYEASLMKRHIHYVHQNNMCSDCQFVAGSIGLLKCYYHAERTSLILVCPFCKYSAKERLEMTAHIILKHTSRCKECYFKLPIEYFLYRDETDHEDSTAEKQNCINKIKQEITI